VLAAPRDCKQRQKPSPDPLTSAQRSATLASIQAAPQTRGSRLPKGARFAHLLIALAICAAPAVGQIPWQPHEPVQLAHDEAGVLVWATDASGAVVQNARVVVVDRVTGAENHGLTNPYGVCVVRGLAPSVYDITVTAPGFWDGGTSRQLKLATMLETRIVLNIRQNWHIVERGGPHRPIPIDATVKVDPARDLASDRTLPFRSIEPLAPSSGDKAVQVDPPSERLRFLLYLCWRNGIPRAPLRASVSPWLISFPHIAISRLLC
jgi:Carboxypeptidase regulatory-like domain